MFFPILNIFFFSLSLSRLLTHPKIKTQTRGFDDPFCLTIDKYSHSIIADSRADNQVVYKIIESDFIFDFQIDEGRQQRGTSRFSHQILSG